MAYREESAALALRWGRVFAALALPALGWYLYQDSVLGFGDDTAVWRLFA
ncbi:MAG: hypothetical protein FJ098_15365, partial [Deltaproteobacteria bacterium]|nr:hypothetical protein [Deltaproteobacteria bacterium]